MSNKNNNCTHVHSDKVDIKIFTRYIVVYNLLVMKLIKK